MTTGSVLAQFTITISQAVSEQVAVEWHTSDGTALAGVDYAAAKGTVLFAPGQTAKTVDILVHGRAVGSEDRSFFVEMLPPTNAILGASIGECIIHVDTTGSTPVTQIIVPTGPQGLQGDSAYQTWLDLGNTGTEQDFLDSLKPSPEEIAEEVAPLLDMGESPVTAEGTASLSKPDTMKLKALAGRVAYAQSTKIATVALADGDNLIAQSDLTGDVLNFSSPGLYPRIMRGISVISPEWQIEDDGRLLIMDAVAGDTLYVCEYDVSSKVAVSRVGREALRRSCMEAGYRLVPGSFESGGVLESANDVLLREATGKFYSWDGAYPPGGHSVAPDTDPEAGGFTKRSEIFLRSKLASAVGAGLVGLSSGTVGDAIKHVTPEMFMFGAPSVTAAIQLAADSGLMIDMSGRDWEITAPITLRDGTTLRLGSANIVANTGTSPLFIFNATTGKGLTIEQGSGIITGTASAFLSCTGLSNTPVNADYVKQIRIRGVHVSSATIDKALHLVNAVRQVFLDSCMFYTRNGIIGSGKIVELKATKCIIYGSTSDTNTAGIQSISPGGGTAYSEGWHFTDCTIDNFEKTFDIRDIYVLTVNGGYVGCNSPTGYAMSFGGRTTTHCREININAVIGGKVIFVSEPTGWLAKSKISGILTRVSSGVALQFVNNAADVDVSGLKFESITGAGCALVGNNCSDILFSDISSDSSPSFGVQFTGANGSGCGVDGFVYRGAGQALFMQRPVIRRGIVSPVAADVAYSQQTDMVAPGSFAAGSTIASISMNVAKGERGTISFALAYSGGNGTSQNLQLSLPAGIVVPTEPGQSPVNTLLLSASGLASRVVPFYASADVSVGVFSLINQAGNALSISSHSSLSVILS